MSRLVTTGDTVSNFGKYLPTPYIDKIYVQDTTVFGTVFAKITVELYVYLRVTDTTDAVSIEDDLQNIAIILNFVNNADNIDSLLSGDAFVGWPTDDPVSSASMQMVTSLAAMEDTGLTEYDDDGNKIIKYWGSFDLTAGTSWADVNSSYLFAWCTAVEGGYDSFVGADTWDTETRKYAAPYGALSHVEGSDIAYEVIFEDGSLASQIETTWVDSQGGAYNGVPLQSISSEYYKVDKISHSEIVTSFQDLINEYEDEIEKDSALKNIIDQISYILAIYGDAANLLPQLNLLRRVFTNKSSVTTVGDLYLKYREKIYTANAVIETASTVSKKIVSNSKVTDSRDPTDTMAVLDERGESDGWKILVNRILFNQRAGDLDEDGSSTDYDYTFITQGYIFTDYTATVCQDSDIFNAYNVDAFLMFFSPQTLYANYKPTEIAISRGPTSSLIYSGWGTSYMALVGDGWTSPDVIEHHGDSEYIMKATINAYKNTVDGFTFDHGAVDTATKAYHVAQSDEFAGFDYSYEGDEQVTNELGYSFCAIRNFVPFNNDFGEFQASSTHLQQDESWSGDYRLMCIQYQVFEDAGSTWTSDETDTLGAAFADSNNSIRTTIVYEDTTTALVAGMIDAFNVILDGLSTYVEAASEACAYNSVDQLWNQAFIDDMTNTYLDDPGSAPWNYYPIYYNIHRELLSSYFGGVMEKLTDDCADITARISPETGNLEQLLSFQAAFVALGEAYYTGTSGNATLDIAYGITIGTETPPTLERLSYKMFIGSLDYSGDYFNSGDYDGSGWSDPFSTWALYTEEATTDEQLMILADRAQEMGEEYDRLLAADEDAVYPVGCQDIQRAYFEYLFAAAGDRDGSGWDIFEQFNQTQFNCLECHDLSLYYAEDRYDTAGGGLSYPAGAKMVGYLFNGARDKCQWSCNSCIAWGGRTDLGTSTDSKSPSDTTYSAYCIDLADGTGELRGDSTLDAGQGYWIDGYMPNGTATTDYWYHCCIGNSFDWDEFEDAQEAAADVGKTLYGILDESGVADVTLYSEDSPNGTCYDLYAAVDGSNSWVEWLTDLYGGEMGGEDPDDGGTDTETEEIDVDAEDSGGGGTDSGDSDDSDDHPSDMDSSVETGGTMSG